MTAPNITKLPWHKWNVQENVIGDDGSYVTKEFTYDIIKEEDMDFAIKCVNNHDKLVEMLGKARKEIDATIESEGTLFGPDREIFEKINALLTSLRGDVG